MIRLWKGYHSRQLFSLVEQAWNRGETLILVPPFLKDLSFIENLPEGEIEFCGDWDISAPALQLAATMERAAASYPAEPVLGVFTSATVSGTPRLVLYSKENIQSSLASILRLYDRAAFDTIFCYPQAFHTFGLTLGYVMALLNDFRLITHPGRYSSQTHESRLALRNERVLTLGTPTHFLDLIHYTESRGLRLTPSYSNIMGGAMVSIQLWNDVRSKLGIAAPSIGYGCTEASPGITHSLPGQVPSEDGEIGQVLSGVDARLLPTQGVEFSGPNVCLAIIHNGKIEFPDRVTVRDDVALRADGVHVFRGRLDLTLNRGGEKFSLERIETTLRSHLGADVMCLAVPHSRLGHELGVLMKAPSTRVDATEITSMLEKNFHTRFPTENFVYVDDLPLNASLKPDRKSGLKLLQKERPCP